MQTKPLITPHAEFELPMDALLSEEDLTPDLEGDLV
jgi:hypothetical protein